VQVGAPQTPGVPPPPQVVPAGHGQVKVPPQPSPLVPQLVPVHVVFGLQALASPDPQTPGVPAPPQVLPGGQGQVNVPPHPSPLVPQLVPVHVVFGVHVGEPQTP
jgi:hypothetical protein